MANRHLSHWAEPMQEYATDKWHRMKCIQFPIVLKLSWIDVLFTRALTDKWLIQFRQCQRFALDPTKEAALHNRYLRPHGF